MQMMLEPDEWGEITESAPTIRPYMDERLSTHQHLYEEFVGDLLAAGMISFTNEPLDIVTPFFVGKKDGILRRVWDCRVPNRRFRKSLPQALGTGRSWGRLSLEGSDKHDQQLYVAQAGVENYFYYLRNYPPL
eukprot:4516083-Karenia_brevis.AAC.1